MPRPYEQFEKIADQLPIGRDPASVRRRLEAVEGILERLFVVPGLNRGVGLDSIVGLIPVVGDVITASMGAWLVWEARNLGMSKFQLMRMIGNVGMDTAIGAVRSSGTCSTSSLVEHAQPSDHQALSGQAPPLHDHGGGGRWLRGETLRSDDQ
jgi:hypothetical protein